MTPLERYIETFNGTQTELAEVWGLSRPYLSLLLAGKRQPSLVLAARIERLTAGQVPTSSWIAEPFVAEDNSGMEG